VTPINVITVICDSRRMKNIRIACRCGRAWEEKIPQELHDSEMIAKFNCPTCGRVHMLKNHVLKSMSKEDFHDKFHQEDSTTFGIQRPGYDAKQDYDA
jgi:predicted RNA-binding Zn-ribbon protein involved in translation (DUF1610 family)